MAAKLLLHVPKHTTYVEVFGGGAALLFAKEPSPIEVFNDIDSGLVNFYRVLRSKEQFERFREQVSLYPYSREECFFCRDAYKTESDSVLKAVKWYVVARQSFGGKFGQGWSYSVNSVSKGMAMHVAGWLSAVDRLPELHARMQLVQVDHRDFRKIIPAYDSPDTFFYLDPPYPRSTLGKCKDPYGSFGLTDNDHEDLVAVLLRIVGRAMLSGYETPLYAPIVDAGWQTHYFDVNTGVVNTRKAGPDTSFRRRECIWVKGT